jgi:glyoxylate/hydroxypyruvate reductase
MCGMGIARKTIGIVGMGRIGFGVAERLKAFKPEKILYSSRTSKPEADKSLGATHVPLHQLLSESDFVILTCALTKETRNLINVETLNLMKKNSILINTARGGLVNQDDLYKALLENRLAAGLDVTTPEPLSPSHPLTTLKNCTILPHIGSATVETREAMASLAVDNLLAGVLGEKLPAQVTF